MPLHPPVPCSCLLSADNGGITRGANCGNNYPLRGQKTSSWEGGVRAVAFMSGGTALITPELRGTTNNAYIHVCDWYGTLLTLVGVDPTDNYTPPPGTVVAESDGPVPPPVDSIDQVGSTPLPPRTATVYM
jgi:arylsulfatase A-like enzyme